MMDPTKQLVGSCRAVSMSASMLGTMAAIRSGRSPVCRRSLCCCFAPDSDGHGLLFLDLKIYDNIFECFRRKDLSIGSTVNITNLV